MDQSVRLLPSIRLNLHLLRGRLLHLLLLLLLLLPRLLNDFIIFIVVLFNLLQLYFREGVLPAGTVALERSFFLNEDLLSICATQVVNVIYQGSAHQKDLKQTRREIIHQTVLHVFEKVKVQINNLVGVELLQICTRFQYQYMLVSLIRPL